MSKEYNISVKSILGNTINTREAAQILLHNLKNDSGAKIIMDFSEVDFISRSFADSLVKKRDELLNAGSFEFSLVNASDSILTMIQSVEKTQNKQKRSESSFIVYKYSEGYLVSEYLLSI